MADSAWHEFFPPDSCFPARKTRIRIPLVFSFHFIFLSAIGALAATFTVNNTADLPDIDQADGVCLAANGFCTLRAAIMQANYNGGSNLIFVLPGVYGLTRTNNDDNAVAGDLDITSRMTIYGTNANTTIIDGNGPATGCRVFHVLDSADIVQLSTMTIRNGYLSLTNLGSGVSWGGGILAVGASLYLNNIILEKNSALTGGGLHSSGNIVEINNSIVRGNSTILEGFNGSGGGIFAAFNIGITIRDSLIYSNTAGNGAGISFEGIASARIERCDVYANAALFDGGGFHKFTPFGYPLALLNVADCHMYDNSAGNTGGAIHHRGSAMNILRTTINSNQTIYRGGGIYNDGVMSITNSTISGNLAPGISDSYGGGGIFNETGSIEMNSATICHNISTNGSGGGIFNNGGTVSAVNTLIAKNTSKTPVNGPDISGYLNSYGYNLVGNTNGMTISGTTFGCKLHLDPLIGPLQNNGGPTPTHALLAGSPAIDAGTNVLLSVDQRGSPRPIDHQVTTNGFFSDANDIGAFELLYQPELYIRRAGNYISVSWSTNGIGFKLEAKTNLLSGNWAVAPELSTIQGDLFTVSNNPSFGTRFFRLKFP